MRSVIIRALLITMLMLAIDVHSELHCFQCLAMNCSDSDPACEGIQSFIKSELASLYRTDHLAKCHHEQTKNGTHVHRRLMQLNNKPCPADKSNGSVCALGRIQIQTILSSSTGSSERVDHATILGCATPQLVANMRSAFRNGKCDLDIRNKSLSNGTSRHLLKIEHCRDISMECNQNNDDYCVYQNNNQVMVWSGRREKLKLDAVTIIGIVISAFVLVVTCVCVTGLIVRFLGLEHRANSAFEFALLSKPGHSCRG